MQQAIIKQKQKHLSAFDLTTNLIRGGLSSLDLSPNTKLVLLYLSTCYNERKGVVFPKIKTIAEAVGISEISCKRAIKELLKENCILKSKRFKNSNEYVITKKILEAKQIDTKPEQKDTSKSIKLILPIEHELKQEEIKEQQTKEEIKKSEAKKVVEVAFSNSSKPCKPLDLQAIPEIIRNNPNIKNPVAYWRSLDDSAKQDYTRKEQEAEELKARQEAEEKEREQRSYENLKRLQEWKNSKPSYLSYTKEQAVQYILETANRGAFGKNYVFKSRFIKQLAEFHKLDLNELLKV